jgi:CRISPR-associated protein Cmr1
VKVITATFRVVTPLFLAGADAMTAELRLPSVKGALRYWYRAINPHFQKVPEGGKATWEEILFGGTGGGAGQSAFFMRKKNENLKIMRMSSLPRDLDYFSFFLRRRCSYISPVSNYADKLSGRFTIQLLLRPHRNANKVAPDWKGLVSSLWMLGHIGGLGARSRRGFGTIALQEWQADDPEIQQWMDQLPIAHEASTIEEWIKRFQLGLQQIQSWFSPWDHCNHTIVDQRTTFFLANEGSDTELKAMVAGMQVIKGFRSEHKEHRLFLGLPLMVSSKKNGQRYQILPERYQRVPSPVWLRVIQIGQQYYPFFAILSAPFPDKLIKKVGKKQKNHPFCYHKALQMFKGYIKNQPFREVR